MQYFANRDRGLVRSRNQDRYLLLPLSGGGLLAAVFDGMGGHADGDLAAETARDCFCELFEGAPPTDEGEGMRRLTDAAREADRRILSLSSEREERCGMGTTVTALLFLSGCVLTLNVGDSRAYRYRLGTLARMTRDDSYVQELADAGVITEEEMLFHPKRNVITRALGSLGRGEIAVAAADTALVVLHPGGMGVLL